MTEDFEFERPKELKNLSEIGQNCFSDDFVSPILGQNLDFLHEN